MNTKKKLTYAVTALIAFALLASTANAYFGCIFGSNNAICFNRGISDIPGDELKVFNLYQADLSAVGLSAVGYTPVNAEIKFTVENPSDVTLGVKYGINGEWYQTVFIEPGESAAIKSNVDIDDIVFGRINKVAFKTTVDVDEILPLRGYLAVKWTRT